MTDPMRSTQLTGERSSCCCSAPRESVHVAIADREAEANKGPADRALGTKERAGSCCGSKSATQRKESNP